MTKLFQLKCSVPKQKQKQPWAATGGYAGSGMLYLDGASSSCPEPLQAKKTALKGGGLSTLLSVSQSQSKLGFHLARSPAMASSVMSYHEIPFSSTLFVYRFSEYPDEKTWGENSLAFCGNSIGHKKKGFSLLLVLYLSINLYLVAPNAENSVT